MIADNSPGVIATPHRQSKRGFTLTEIAIVLGIIGLILGAIWVAAAAVYNNLRVSSADTEVLQLAQGIRGLYATSTTTTGLTVDQLVCAKAAPSNMITAVCGTPGTLSDPFPGGATTVSPVTDGYGFTITMSNVPRSACDALIVAVAGPSRDPGLFLATAAATTPAATATTAAAITTAITPTAADTLCSAGATDYVTFGFSLK